ncbi:hypothetical protein N657DRAFT_683763 [Parathielavia appendiculata]|uniref:Uncharacterized protein n=1 Tax=Parathielavia appendiculata TaxID=2587402 RepID=A0AAN6TT09_9PEZI|nr:hypothetical protein N657DRAFT_683763 [Parathielavia appendiculata]
MASVQRLPRATVMLALRVTSTGVLYWWTTWAGNDMLFEDDKEPQHLAVLNLIISGKAVSFPIYSNPIFVAAPRCIDGAHPVHERDLPMMQDILRVGQLSGHIHNNHRVLVIDAKGVADCELAARAWCAGYDQHGLALTVR